MANQVLNIAHRGASEYLPDNTLESFDRALAENADMIELDVRKTIDGKLVLFHDWTVNIPSAGSPDTNIPKLVSHASSTKLQESCQRNGYRLAMLDETLEHFGGRLDINIELKAGGYEKDVVDLVNEFGLVDSVIISSFFPWIIKKIKNYDNRFKAGWIIGQEQVILLNRLARPIVSLLFDKIEADSAHFHYEIITPAVIKHFHLRQIPIFAWTVNNEHIFSYLIDMGVDGIITDRPGVLHSILQKETNNMVNQLTGSKLIASFKKA
ncbi:MAG: glycerophosphodiester phosphodiesterase [candidate division Zixibacteria bacterium]|nr:glycerophosphodiester phosphodiesterase [candidate division Zixibacteria bacterium]